MFDWNDLRHFLAVARFGSTLAAAKALKVNQSTVHRRLDELEKRLGHQLVVRQPTGYKLTELGQDMVTYAKKVEEAVQAFERRLAASDTGLTGSIKVTCPEAIGVRLLHSPLIAKFNERYPSLRVEFIISDKLLDLAKGEADIAIRATAPFDETLFGRKIADTLWGIYASAAYIARAGTIMDVADIARHSVALFDIEQHVTKAWLQSVAPAARVAARCNSMTALLSAAKSGVGLAALPMTIGDSEPDLVRVLGPIPGLTTNFYLLIHQDMKTTPRVRVLFDFFIEELDKVRPILAGESPALLSSAQSK
jgi:DNA-binding transcriptional LysR family regulator